MVYQCIHLVDVCSDCICGTCICALRIVVCENVVWRKYVLICGVYCFYVHMFDVYACVEYDHRISFCVNAIHIT